MLIGCDHSKDLASPRQDLKTILEECRRLEDTSQVETFLLQVGSSIIIVIITIIVFSTERTWLTALERRLTG